MLSVDNKLTTTPLLKSILLLAVSVFIAACSQAKLTPIPVDGTILAFGDSLTYGKGVELTHSYPSVLERLSGRTVVNAGVSGEVTSAGLKRFGDVLDKHNPHLVILLEGGNDILRNLNLDNTRQNLAAMIEITQNRGISLVLVGCPEKVYFQTAHHFTANWLNNMMWFLPMI